MKRAAKKVKRYNGENDSLVEKEGKGFFGERQKWKEDSSGRKFVDVKDPLTGRVTGQNRYYSADDIKSKLGMGENKPPKSHIESQLDRANSGPNVEESPKSVASSGIASNWKSDQEVFKRADNEVKLPAASVSKTKTTVTRKLPSNKNAPSYSGVVSSKDLGSQSFSAPAKKDQGSMLGTTLAALAATGAGAAANAMMNRKRNKGLVNKNETPVRVREIDPNNYDLTTWEGEGGKKRGGVVKKMASGGKVRTASQRADGCAIRGKTRA